MYLRKNDGALRQRNAPTKTPTAANDNSKPTFVARGTADELRQIAAALDATSDSRADAVTAMAAHAVLEKFRRSNRFVPRPNVDSIADFAIANQLTEDLALAIFHAYERGEK